jgi:hypothetical protein
MGTDFDELAGLIALRDAAECCNGLALEALRHFSKPPLDYGLKGWDRHAPGPKAEVRPWLKSAIESRWSRIKEAIRQWDGVDNISDLLWLLEHAIGLKAKPIFIAGYSYPSAHQAARAFAELVSEKLNSLDGDTNLDIAKNLAIDLRPLRKLHCLYARIQGEFHEAAKLIESEEQDDYIGGRMTKEVANEKMMALAKNNPDFVKKGIHDMAKEIGCSSSTIHKTSFWRTLRDQTGRSRNKNTPKVVSLTDSLEATVGEGDEHEILERLIQEQNADHEPSPLESSSPRYVKHYRKL